MLTLTLVASVMAWAAPLTEAHAGPPACTVLGTPRPDVLVGTAGHDVICGLGGNDTLLGKGGNDRLIGGPGADELRGGDANDALEGGPGSDTASYVFSDAAITASLRGGTASGQGDDTLAGVERLAGSRVGDTLVGSNGGNRIDGGRGRDVIRGLGGDDTLLGRKGDDILRSGDGGDLLRGGLDADRLEGGLGADTIEGGSGFNRMLGGPGVDTCVQKVGHGSTGSCERRWRPVVFATAYGLPLYQPAVHPVLITYHESLFRSAIALRPRGHLILNDNPRRYRAPPSSPGPGYVVMSGRGRAPPATSASDDVLRTGTPVLAPVSGRVISVTPYMLYCEAYDIRIVIRPNRHPRVTVVIFHVDDVRVHAGQRVAYSATVMGVPRVFGGTPQTDHYVPGHHPHVHIEVERNGSSPTPGCPLRGRGAE